jgi:hypothetical protein
MLGLAANPTCSLVDALADRLEDARTDALATLARTRYGPQAVPLGKPQVSGLVRGVGGGT